MVRGNQFSTINTTLTDLITFAYGVQQKQIVDAPSWMDTDKWDIEAQPDVPGTPKQKQLTTMVQKLLADRFQLKFHNDKKELSAYVLTVAKSGQKMTAGSTDPNQLPGLFFRATGRADRAERHHGRFCGTDADGGAGPAGCGPDRAAGQMEFPAQVDAG